MQEATSGFGWGAAKHPAVLSRSLVVQRDAPLTWNRLAAIAQHPRAAGPAARGQPGAQGDVHRPGGRSGWPGRGTGPGAGLDLLALWARRLAPSGYASLKNVHGQP
jgi:hypothetical protein